MDFIEKLLGQEMKSEEAVSIETLKSVVRVLRKYYQRTDSSTLEESKWDMSESCYAYVSSDYTGIYYESYYDEDCQYNAKLSISNTVELYMTIEMRYVGMVEMRVLEIPSTLAYGLIATLIRYYNNRKER